MKYYVYAGYYENFISGHKLPKPYILRDEFKTFDDALDYVWENWEDDDIFFTEDVIDDAIDNGVIDDENWEDYLMEESKKSARKPLREMFGNEGIVDDFVDFLIYDCEYDEKTVKKYFYKKYKLNGLDVIPIKLYIQIKNEIEDVLGYNDIM